MKKIRKTIILIIGIVCITGLSSCYYTDNETMKGAGVGAGIGAITGAIIGNQSDKPVTGAAVGAAAGGLLGGYQGKKAEEQKQVNRSQEERIRQLEDQVYHRY